LQELASSLGDAQSLERNTVSSLARALEAVHVGMEPDVLHGARTPKADDTVVLFSLPPGELEGRSSATYQAAALTVQLATAVALADGELGAEELRHLRHQIEGWTHLTPAHQQRLRAHMRYLVDAPPSLAVLKKKLEPLAAPAKEAIAKFMSVVAQADGHVSPAEIKMLEKVYKALGVDPQKVFSDVHAVAAAAPGGKRAAAVPVVTAPAEKPATTGFQLDAARVAALQQDTDKVSALLANIFKEEPTAATAPQPAALTPEPEEVEAEAPHGLMGLDDAHTSFVNQLVSRPEWTREELLDLASDLDLMLDGALERINEAAFDAHDGPLTEGDDPVTINRDILEKVPA
jgi:tellurite resistance protein